MTGQEMMEQLQAMTPEELGREVVVKYYDSDGYRQQYQVDVRVSAEFATQAEVPLLAIQAPRGSLIPVIAVG